MKIEKARVKPGVTSFFKYDLIFLKVKTKEKAATYTTIHQEMLWLSREHYMQEIYAGIGEPQLCLNINYENQLDQKIKQISIELESNLIMNPRATVS